MTLFKKLQASIMQLWRELDSEPSTELGEQLCHQDADENFVLSSHHLDELTELQKKVLIFEFLLKFPSRYKL